ncbi:MAG: glycosyltransferase family 2 protein, partial [Spirochaetes bacterium]|nr:glycosyltransferase family 2 protein [Spirochaetota bacterium]
TVEEMIKTIHYNIEYYNEKKQNISLARNMVLDNAKLDLLAFIDDDEIPVDNWLLLCLKNLEKYDCDGILGPVKPSYITTPPKWIIKSKIFERPEHPTGHKLDADQTRTGNVLNEGKIFIDKDNRFDPKFGKTGGEDKELFRKLINKGFNFFWCNEAVAYEKIPSERFKRSYFLRFALRSGSTTLLDENFNKKSIFRSIIAFLGYSFILPFLFIFKHHLFMKYLIKDVNHIGKLLAVCGFVLVDKRDEF